ncbi:type II secretion system F family protein [Rhodococcus spelaei]|uniref:Type II secretion system F family protein n=1 Tax=Rhodococcus spelaei TaxID=2546320 RepID=A0A541BRN7_9NOCA|nr:type II secretion system F family protein [Rhodococcus spelaei]TQF74980.1 type II secretion system F family protein [Rhodococcus spelaei]
MIAVSVVLLGAALLVAPGATAATGRLRAAVRPTAEPGESTVVGPAVDDPMAGAAGYDLLAACLRSGLPMAVAAAAVAPTSPEPLAGALRSASNLLALGAEPEIAWAKAAAEPETETLARTARRSARSGASLAVAMSELATECRTAVEDRGAAAAERAGVLISGPLGLCFLPAFLCLGIVPVVVGLATRVLGQGLL